MPVLGITGGAGSGKSSFTALLRQTLEASHFDTDACARRLLATDPDVLEELRAAFGSAVVTDHGEVSRGRLREIVFSDASRRRTLEEILHPRIRSEWTALANQLRGPLDEKWLIVEIPLLFETKAEALFDLIAVVGCAQSQQRQRLITDRNLPPDLVDLMIAAQLPLGAKLERADYLVWNAGDRAQLSAQAGLLSKKLKALHG